VFVLGGNGGGDPSSSRSSLNRSTCFFAPYDENVRPAPVVPRLGFVFTESEVATFLGGGGRIGNCLCVIEGFDATSLELDKVSLCGLFTIWGAEFGNDGDGEVVPDLESLAGFRGTGGAVLEVLDDEDILLVSTADLGLG